MVAPHGHHSDRSFCSYGPGPKRGNSGFGTAPIPSPVDGSVPKRSLKAAICNWLDSMRRPPANVGPAGERGPA
ncbi:uncharacterized protein TRUGW13939_06388 [Talaromyces rugulosus]|uniref:Uncharacterized protein n=1 Tax=Talaromyces rugulosus TaxID=121627 RepID=A0A7H8QZR4_TALRU|nr:uncharacterized protein TRUGW13939_06388 [Talaromyces rugulosus]QKX59256.1 hypothetical protein TRUGW13939_06388 [Talaromyces rugulosus]